MDLQVATWVNIDNPAFSRVLLEQILEVPRGAEERN